MRYDYANRFQANAGAAALVGRLVVLLHDDDDGYWMKDDFGYKRDINARRSQMSILFNNRPMTQPKNGWEEKRSILSQRCEARRDWRRAQQKIMPH
jgi:hypothetical protein